MQDRTPVSKQDMHRGTHAYAGAAARPASNPARQLARWAQAQARRSTAQEERVAGEDIQTCLELQMVDLLVACVSPT